MYITISLNRDKHQNNLKFAERIDLFVLQINVFRTIFNNVLLIKNNLTLVFLYNRQHAHCPSDEITCAYQTFIYVFGENALLRRRLFSEYKRDKRQ